MYVEKRTFEFFCLGPTLFLIFVNCIDNAMDTTIAIISKVADDTKAGRVVEGDNNRAKLQEEINNLMEWAEMGGYAPVGWF